MRKFLLLCFTAFVFLACSQDELTEESQIVEELQLRGNYEIVNKWQNGIQQPLPSCDFPETLEVNQQIVLFTLVSNESSCSVEVLSYTYTVDSNVVTLNSGNRVVKLEVFQADQNLLRFQFIYDTDRGGLYNGQIWEYDRLINSN